MCACLQRRRVRHNANYVPYAQMPACPLSSIGLYRENAIAIQNESGDSNGGNV